MVSLPNIYIFRIYTRSFLIFLTKTLSNFSYTSLLRSFAAINLFIAASRFSQNSLSNVSIIVLLLNSLIAICRQNYSFFLKPPRKSQEICKLSENYYKKTGHLHSSVDKKGSTCLNTGLCRCPQKVITERFCFEI